MTTGSANVFLVDDDESVLRALSRLLGAVGHRVWAYQTAQEFLDDHDPAVPGCLVLDLVMPGLSGLEVQNSLAVSGCARPVIFLTGRGSVPTTVRAMKGGAVDFLTKPICEQDLLVAVDIALERDRSTRSALAEQDAIAARIKLLTRREREVMQHVVGGRLNKQIAADLGTVEKTIKVHRSRVMEKMGVRSVADLVRLTERAGIAAVGSQVAPGQHSVGR